MSPANITKQEETRIRIDALLDARIKHKQIKELTGTSYATIGRIAMAKRLGTALKTYLKRKEGSGTKKRLVTADFVKNFIMTAAEDPTRSIWAHSRQLNVSTTTIINTMKIVSLRSFVRRRQQLITDVAKEKRLARAQRLLTWLKSKENSATVKIFSDKKIFTVNQFHNRRNDR